MKVCHNCEVHSICPELETVIDDYGEKLEFCSDYCREQFIENAKPQVTTALVYWCDGDIGYVKRVDKAQACEIMRSEVKLRSIDFGLVAKQCGTTADPDCIYDLINAVNYHNSTISNPVSYYFKEIE